MEKENNSPGTIQVSKENREAIILQYLGQNLFARTPDGRDNAVMGFRKPAKFSIAVSHSGDIKHTCFVEPKDVCLILKSLGGISDADAIQVAKFCHSYSHKDDHVLQHEGKDLIANYVKQQSNVHGYDWLKVFDFLRSRGYALPYGPYSVEQLVEAGIYKIIN